MQLLFVLRSNISPSVYSVRQEENKIKKKQEKKKRTRQKQFHVVQGNMPNVQSIMGCAKQNIREK